jgi:hypothetical protein
LTDQEPRRIVAAWKLCFLDFYLPRPHNVCGRADRPDPRGGRAAGSGR